MAIRPLPTAVVHHAVTFERAVENLAAAAAAAMVAVNLEHQVFGGIPTVHQNRAKRNLAHAKSLKHLGHMIELALAVALRIIQPIVQNPKAPTTRMDVKARDQADAVDDLVLVAAPLPARHLDTRPKLFVEHRVVKDHVSLLIKFHHLARVLPQQAWRQHLAAQLAVDGVMTPTLQMLSQIGQRIVDLAANQNWQ